MSVYLTVFGKPRYLGIVEVESPTLVPGEPVVIETMRGIETATVGGPISGEQAELYRKANENIPKDGTQGGEPGLQTVTFVAQASADDLTSDQENRRDEEDVLVKAKQLLGEQELMMKIVDVEYLLDRKKLFFYFTAEQRVDFRAYVRDLAREFRTRIELRQIGVRDEAKVVKGIAPCGKPCCCSYWLHSFLPIGIKMVKEQNLALNPTKISGLCGRLMCCMSYEHNVYRELWKKLPSPGNKIRSPKGSFVLVGVDIDGESALVRTPEGGHVPISVGEFDKFKEAILAGEDWQPFVAVQEKEGELPPVEPIFPKRSVRNKNDIAEPRAKDGRSTADEDKAQEKNSEREGSSDKPKNSSRRRRRKRKKPVGDRSTDKGQRQENPNERTRPKNSPKRIAEDHIAESDSAKKNSSSENGDGKIKSRRRRRKKKTANAANEGDKDGKNVSKGGTLD